MEVFMFKVDGSQNKYLDIKMDNNENIRLTYIKNSWHNEDGFRIQIQDSTGHLRQGPEIPFRYTTHLIASLYEIALNCNNNNSVKDD